MNFQTFREGYFGGPIRVDVDKVYAIRDRLQNDSELLMDCGDSIHVSQSVKQAEEIIRKAKQGEVE
jgi:prefoldin subunit 5